MRDLIDPRLMYLNAWLFLLAGCTAAGVLILQDPSLRTAPPVAITVWAFSCLYYFLFYVIEKYIEPGEGAFRFAGVGSTLVHAVRRRGGLRG